MKKLISIILMAIVSLMPFAYAQEEASGIMPDSALYGLDRALDRINFVLSSDKPGKGLEIAQERLLEAADMAEEYNEKAMIKAIKHYNKTLEDVETAIEEIESDGDMEKAKKAMEDISKLQNKTEEHYQKVVEVKDRILERQRDRMSAEQIAHLEEVFSKIKEKAKGIENKVDNKKENAKIKYKALSKKSNDEVDAEEKEIDRKTGLTEARKERAIKMIAKAEKTLEAAKIRLRASEMVQAAGKKGTSDLVEMTAELEAVSMISDKLSQEEMDAIIAQINELQELISKASETGDSKAARDIAEEINDFGYDISIAKKTGKITVEDISESYNEHNQRIMEKSRNGGGQ